MRRTALVVIALATFIPGCGVSGWFPPVPYNGLAKTPPMGWNSWNHFATTIDDTTVRAIADAMVSNGMRDAGFTYVNLDDGWQGQRDSAGSLQPNERFPNIKALADYVHARGLKFGVYSSPGPKTCAGFEGSYQHEEQDANTFASWGVDYLKYDWCGASAVYPTKDFGMVFEKMAQALQATGRPIVYSLSNSGEGDVEIWGARAGANLWRTTSDIQDSWESMMRNIESQGSDFAFAGPGHWNDPDMLEIGNGGMTNDEYKTHMSLWAMASAPLIAGNDLRTMPPETAAILLNPEVLAIDQDRLGKQASLRIRGSLQTWVKPLADGSVAVAIVNPTSQVQRASFDGAALNLSSQIISARDVWAHQDLTLVNGGISAAIATHCVLLLKIIVS